MAKLLLFGWQILWLCYGVSTLDFFIFALQYPVGYCKVTVKYEFSHADTLNLTYTFTLKIPLEMCYRFNLK